MGRVNKDCVQMSEFVKKELGVSDFKNGEAFYEFTHEEDLLYYRDVVHLGKNDEVKCSD